MCLCHPDAEAPKAQTNQSNAPDGTATDQQADLEERVEPVETLCRRAVCIPGWLWRKVAVKEPVSSKLQLAGVCISLRQCMSASEPTPATSHVPGTRNAEADVQPAVMVSGTDLRHLDERSHTNHVSPIAHAHLLPGTRLMPAAAPQPSAAFVTHTLLRQWGVEASVTILPVGWIKEGEEESAAMPSRVIAPGQPYNLQTRGLARLNRIWESHEGDGDDATPKSPSVKSLFHSNANGHQIAGHENGSPGLLFTNRQNNPLCKLSPTFMSTGVSALAGAAACQVHKVVPTLAAHRVGAYQVAACFKRVNLVNSTQPALLLQHMAALHLAMHLGNDP